MSEPPKHEPAVTVFIGDDTRMGCQLMADAMRRSRYNLIVVGCACDSAGVAKGLRDNSARVAIISARLAEGATAGLVVARKMRASLSKTDVIVMLDSLEHLMVVEAFQSGAAGIFSRDQPFELLCKCVHKVSRGQVWAGSTELRFLIDAFARGPAMQPSVRRPSILTNREEDLVNLVSEGLTNRDISRRLKLSENTVRNYLFRIFNKVGTGSRLELALYAVNRRREQHPQQP